MEYFTLNNIGLFLDIIGAVIIYKYGLPSAETRSIHAIAFSDPSDKEKRDIKTTKVLSPVGIILLIIGFFFQLLGNIFC